MFIKMCLNVTLVSVVVVVVAILASLVVVYPPPPLSTRLLDWQGQGKFFNYDGHDVFYMGLCDWWNPIDLWRKRSKLCTDKPMFSYYALAQCSVQKLCICTVLWIRPVMKHGNDSSDNNRKHLLSLNSTWPQSASQWQLKTVNNYYIQKFTFICGISRPIS